MLKKLLFVCLAMGLTACAGNPSMVLSPAPDTPTVSLGSHEMFALSTLDMRTHQYVVAIRKKEDANQLIHSNRPVERAVRIALENSWRNMGITLSRHGTNKIKVSVLDALTEVEQSLLDYNAETVISLEVKIDVGTRQVSKVFNGKATETGPLKPDITNLERNFNRLLSRILSDILADPLLQEYLHKAA
jgi:uncharacterized lipoprotein YajG